MDREQIRKIQDETSTPWLQQVRDKAARGYNRAEYDALREAMGRELYCINALLAERSEPE